jgi:hypothetical protein
MAMGLKGGLPAELRTSVQSGRRTPLPCKETGPNLGNLRWSKAQSKHRKWILSKETTDPGKKLLTES